MSDDADLASPWAQGLAAAAVLDELASPVNTVRTRQDGSYPVRAAVGQ